MDDVCGRSKDFTALLATSLNDVISSWHILLVLNGLYQFKLYLIAK